MGLATAHDQQNKQCEPHRHDLHWHSVCICQQRDCCEQALSFWGVLEELDMGKAVPNLKGLGFSMLGSNDSLVFTSNTWNITLDPESGDYCPERMSRYGQRCYIRLHVHPALSLRNPHD